MSADAGSAAVEAYLATCRPDQRDALSALREILRRHLPDHPEVISYAMPGLRQPGPKGKMVAGYAAFAQNCGYYPHSGAIIPQFAADLTDYKTTKGGVLFTATHPLPEPLIAKLIAARLAEITATSR